MEYVDGDTLSTQLKDGSALEEDQALEVADHEVADHGVVEPHPAARREPLIHHRDVEQAVALFGGRDLDGAGEGGGEVRAVLDLLDMRPAGRFVPLPPLDHAAPALDEQLRRALLPGNRLHRRRQDLIQGPELILPDIAVQKRPVKLDHIRQVAGKGGGLELGVVRAFGKQGEFNLNIRKLLVKVLHLLHEHLALALLTAVRPDRNNLFLCLCLRCAARENRAEKEDKAEVSGREKGCCFISHKHCQVVKLSSCQVVKLC